MSEIPDMITLSINISNCPNNCKGCHSSYLKNDIGEELTPEKLLSLIPDGIDCVCFMGGDSDPLYIIELAKHVKHIGLLVGWYSGKENINKDVLCNLEYFNFIKIGPYIEELGPLNNPNTNQRMYEVQLTMETDNIGSPIYSLADITDKFWKI